MKKLFFMSLIAISAIAVTGCTQSKIKSTLKNYVSEPLENEEKYELVSVTILEKAKFNDAVKILDDFLINEVGMKFLSEEPNKDEFTKFRNQDFVVFHSFDPDYEYEIMEGKLKNEGEWCTKLRVITEKADSLLKVWNTVDNMNPDYVFLMTWYQKRYNQFYEYESSSMLKKYAENPAQIKELLEYKKSLATMPKNRTALYKVEHIFSINNTFNNVGLKVKAHAIISPDYKVIAHNVLEYIPILK